MTADVWFRELWREYEEKAAARNAVVKRSGDMLRLSKQAIFSAHRDDFTEAEARLSDASALLGDIKKLIATDRALMGEGTFRAALEEYSEATIFLGYAKGGALKKLSVFGADTETYLGGLADATGEIVRRSVLAATRFDEQELRRAKQFSESVLGLFMGLDITGNLRSKGDAVKHNVRKIEELLLEVTLAGRRRA